MFFVPCPYPCTCPCPLLLLVTFRGSPRVSPAETLAMAQKRIRLVPGMSDRVRVFALPEYQLINGPTPTPGTTPGR